MNILSLVLTAFALSMDAFAVALAKGMQAKKTLMLAICLAICFGFFQGIMPLIGYTLASSFATYISSFDHWIAFILLILLGLNMIKEANNDDEQSENKLTISMIIILGIATSIDALAVGVSFAFLNVNIIQAITIISITTLIFSFIGVYIGNKLGNYLMKYAGIIGGLILIIIGTKILIEHLFF